MGLVRLDLGLGGPARPAHAVCTSHRRVGPPATDRAALEPGRIRQQHDPAGSRGGPGRVSPDPFLQIGDGNSRWAYSPGPHGAAELISFRAVDGFQRRLLDLINLGPTFVGARSPTPTSRYAGCGGRTGRRDDPPHALRLPSV